MSEININDTAYYRSPYPTGSVLKVKVKDLDYLAINHNEEQKFSGFRFLVEPTEVIIDGNDHYEHPNNDNDFIVVEEYLHHDLEEALDAFNKTKDERLKLVKKRLKKQNNILSLIESTSKHDEEISVAETEIVNVRSKDIKAIKNSDKTYYTFFDWEVERGINLEEVVDHEKPLIFSVEINKGTLNNKTSEFSYGVDVEKSFGVNKEVISCWGYIHFDVYKLEHLHNTYESALNGLKLRIIELIEELEKEIKALS